MISNFFSTTLLKVSILENRFTISAIPLVFVHKGAEIYGDINWKEIDLF